LPTTPITPDADASRIPFKDLAAEAVAELGAASAADVPGGGPAAAILRYPV
jgi:hypothetical protein